MTPPNGSIILPLSPFNLSPIRGEEEVGRPQKRKKRVRLLLDARTELTNEELEVYYYNILWV